MYQSTSTGPKLSAVILGGTAPDVVWLVVAAHRLQRWRREDHRRTMGSYQQPGRGRRQGNCRNTLRAI